MTLARGVESRAAVLGNLHDHIRQFRGDGHGEIEAFPDGLDPDSLSEYVEREPRFPD